MPGCSAYIASLNRRYAREARDAKVVLVKLRPVVKADEKGLSVRQRALFSELDTALTAGDRTPVRIPFKHTKPAVTASSFKSVIVIERSSNRLVVWNGKHRWGTFGSPPDRRSTPPPWPVRDRHEAREPVVVSA